MEWMRFLPCQRDADFPIQVIDLPPAESGEALDEAVAAVRDIVKKYPAPHTIMLSGGVDSQAMLYAWYKAEVPFKAVSFTYGDLNKHDVETLQKFIEQNGLDVQVEYRQFDVVKFLESNYPEYAVAYECSSPQICTHMKMSEQIEKGTVIFSGNYVMNANRSGPSLSHAILGMVRYARQSGRAIVPFFFLYNAPLAYSFIKYDDTTILNGYETKVQMYQAAGFPVVPQPDKYTGFELIKEMYDQQEHRVDVKTRLKFAGKPSKRVFDILFRYPYEQQFNDPKIDYVYSFLKREHV